MKMQGKTVIVTGGGRGIGFGISSRASRRPKRRWKGMARRC